MLGASISFKGHSAETTQRVPITFEKFLVDPNSSRRARKDPQMTPRLEVMRLDLGNNVKKPQAIKIPLTLMKSPEANDRFPLQLWSTQSH